MYFYIKRRIVFFQLEAKCDIIHRLLNLFEAYEGLPKLINFQQSKTQQTSTILKFGLFEKGTKFEKIFHLKFDVLTLLSNVKYKVEDFFKLCALLKKSEL